MTAIYRFLQLQQQGLSEQEIIGSLQQEGFSMKDINDSLNQARIKNAVSQEPEQNTTGNQEEQNYEVASTNNPPIAQMAYSGNAPQQSYQGSEYQQYQDYPSQQEYGGYYSDALVGNTETVTDIAEQVIAKKTQEMTRKIDDLSQSRNRLQRDIEELKERLKRIETSLDSIQRAIIGKIGEFGESTRMVQRDLENIHGTMSKMMNPLIDNYNELKKLNSKF